MSDSKYLEALPSRTIRARVIGTKRYAKVYVDGDYDGEYIDQYNWTITSLGYVVTHEMRNEGRVTDSDTGEFIANAHNGYYQYLHTLVLPPRKGYWVTFKNGNKLDCRSANLEYTLPKDKAHFGDKLRKERKLKEKQDE